VHKDAEQRRRKEHNARYDHDIGRTEIIHIDPFALE
jgi:hypothetical protein